MEIAAYSFPIIKSNLASYEAPFIARTAAFNITKSFIVKLEDNAAIKL